jgi:Ring finger domain
MECPICYEDMNEHLTKLKCGHTFHKRCLDRWAQEQCTCPYCRYVFRYKVTPDTMMFFMMFTIVAYTYFFFLVAFSG